MKVYILLLTLFFTSTADHNIVFTDFDEVKKVAAEEDKKILMVFSGSDWCRPCIMFEREVLSQESFAQAVKDEYLILKVDFPRLKKNRLSEQQQRHNEALAETYNAKGEFPKLIIVNSEGEVLKEMGYKAGTGAKSFLLQM